jgi:nucleoside phosphorylase
MPSHTQKALSAVILTATPVEYRAICSFMDDRHNDDADDAQEKSTSTGFIYEHRTFSADGQRWKVAIVQADRRNVSLQTQHIIAYVKPSVVFFVGIADGLKNDVAIGDVVVATKIYSYEGDKTDNSFRLRPEVFTSDYSLLQVARAEAKKDGWLDYLKKFATALSSKLPHVYIAPLIAGAKALSSPELYHALHLAYGDAVAVEIGEDNLLQAFYANQSVNALIIRGISDLIGSKSHTPQDRQIAARNASAFTCQLLADLATPPQSKSHEATIPQLSAPAPTKIEIFIAYAEEDERYAQILQRHLVFLKRRGLITTWHNGKLTAGHDALSEQTFHLDNAHIILLLISPDFLNSDDFDTITKHAQERLKENAAVVIPILLRPTDWQTTPFGNLQAFPRGNKPITKFSDPDMAFADIALELRSVAELLQTKYSN